MPLKRKLIQCSTEVKRDAIRRETVDGVEHIIVSSYTLPDNVVMNGGLYPADEIEASYKTLERTLAPVEHPHDSDGHFLSANDPFAIHNFHAGAFNMNVKRENGRVHLEKWINVQEATKTERGRRLLDRINEIETNESPRPIHSSTGVFLSIEPIPKPLTNAAGDEYTWIARDMVFDHDAILLNSIGAAKPSQGVGLAVNADGERVEVEQVTIKPENNQSGASMSDKHRAVMDALERSAIRDAWIEELFDDEVIFSTESGLFTVPYRFDEDRATIVGLPVPVDRRVTYQPKTNQKGDAMKDIILNALKAAGVETDGLSDDELLAKYNEAQAAVAAAAAENQGKGTPAANSDQNEALAAVVTNALKPFSAKLDSLEAKINEKDSAEHARLAGIVANSGKYPALDEESAKLLPVAKLKEMAATCNTAHGVPMAVNFDSADSALAAPADMPE